MAAAIGMASTIVTIALEMVVPAIAGHWLDGLWGTGRVLVVLGLVLGMILAGWHLIWVVAKLSAADSDRRSKKQP